MAALSTATIAAVPTNMRNVDTGKSPGTSKKPLVRGHSADHRSS
jgi:hypothetical protein